MHVIAHYSVGVSKPASASSCASIISTTNSFSIDTVLACKDNILFYFKGSMYIPCSMIDSVCVAADVAQPIASRFPGVFSENIDAAILWPGDETKAYFFRDNEYMSWNFVNECVDESVEVFGDLWPALLKHFPSGIDAVWCDVNVFFLKGNKYIYWILDERKFNDEGPLDVPSLKFFKEGMYEDDISAVLLKTAESVKFFRGDKYKELRKTYSYYDDNIWEFSGEFPIQNLLIEGFEEVNQTLHVPLFNFKCLKLILKIFNFVKLRYFVNLNAYLGCELR